MQSSVKVKREFFQATSDAAVDCLNAYINGTYISKFQNTRLW